MTRVAVVGASGCVGRAMIEVLEGSPLGDDPPIFYASPKSRHRRPTESPDTAIAAGAVDGSRPLDVSLPAPRP